MADHTCCACVELLTRERDEARGNDEMRCVRIDQLLDHHRGDLDRIDALTKERDEAREAWRVSQNVHASFCDAPATRTRVAALETALRCAPHGLNDSFVRCKYDVPPHICDCWKRAALEGK